MRSLLLLLFLISTPCLGQKSIERLWHLGNKTTKVSDEKALVIFEKAFKEAERLHHPLWQATICVDQSGSLYNLGQYKAAIDRCLLGLKILKDQRLASDSTRFKLHSAIAACYKLQYNLPESFRQFESANKILHQHPELENQIPLYVTFHFINQGSTWYSLGDIDRAVFYYDKGQATGKKLPAKISYSLVLFKIANIHKYKKDFPLAIKTIKEGIATYKVDGKMVKDPFLGEVYLSLAECYQENGDLGAAAEAVSASRQIALLSPQQERARDLLPLTGLFSAGLHLKNGQKDKASAIYTELLKKKATSRFYNINTSYQAYKGLSDIAYAEGNYALALDYVQRALSEASGEKMSDALINPRHFPSLFTAIGTFVTLNRKVEILSRLYQQKNELNYLKAAYATQKLSVNLAKKIRQSHETMESRALFSHSFYERYERLVGLCYALYEKTRSAQYADSAFAIMEEGKSLILSDNLALQSTYRNLDSDSLIGKLKANQAYLAYLKGSEGNNGENIKSYESKVNQLLETLNVVNRPFVESYRSGGGVNLAAFKKKLDRQSLYLNYVRVDNFIYVSMISRNKTGFVRIAIDPEEFSRNKQELARGLTTNPGPFAAFKSRKNAHYFYRILVKPFETHLGGIEHLIINPDNEFIELSFDVFLDDAGSDDFLIKKYTVAYLNSALNYNNHLDDTFARSQNWLSFAPFGSKSKNNDKLNIQNITLLPSTISEIKGIKGQAVVNEQSTKSNFVETIGRLKDRVILIATHAAENNGEPYLNFFPADDNFKLYANEIQYLDFRTPLVILGACETNAGKKLKGSGVLSISKAFAIGGCPSVVGSLWEVHDESMAVLVSLFYKNLMRGERKDVALRLAKLEYLETDVGLRNDPPYYWAHLQVIGDVAPLIFWPVILRYALYGVFVLVFVGGLIYTLRSRKRLFN